MTARILIVEDEEPLTMLLRYNLEAEGSETGSNLAPSFYLIVTSLLSLAVLVIIRMRIKIS
jgi:hypothetical protein